jgi:hypothetical protein
MGNIYYMSPVQEVLERMTAHIETAMKELDKLRADHHAITSQHPSLTERTDEEAE